MLHTPEKSTPKIFGIVTNILLLIGAWRKAPKKSSCFILTFRRGAWAKTIFRDQNEAVGDHLYSVVTLPWRSPQTTIRVSSLSRVPSLLIFTLKISITGVLTLSSLMLCKIKIWASSRVLSSVFTDFSHPLHTGPIGMFRELSWELAPRKVHQ